MHPLQPAYPASLVISLGSSGWAGVLQSSETKVTLLLWCS